MTNQLKLFVILKCGGDKFNYEFLQSIIVKQQSNIVIPNELQEKVNNVFEKCKIADKVEKFSSLFDKDLNCNFLNLFDDEDIAEVKNLKCFITGKPIENDFVVMDDNIYSLEALNAMSKATPKLKQKLVLPHKGVPPLKPLVSTPTPSTPSTPKTISKK